MPLAFHIFTFPLVLYSCLCSPSKAIFYLELIKQGEEGLSWIVHELNSAIPDDWSGLNWFEEVQTILQTLGQGWFKYVQTCSNFSSNGM